MFINITTQITKVSLSEQRQNGDGSLTPTNKKPEVLSISGGKIAKKVRITGLHYTNMAFIDCMKHSWAQQYQTFIHMVKQQRLSKRQLYPSEDTK